MKKFTKILIAIAFLIIAITINAQNNCHVLCHNGTLLIGVNTNAKDVHIAHGDSYIGEVCNYEVQGNECELLSTDEKIISTRIFTYSRNTKILDIKDALYIQVYDTNKRLLISNKNSSISLNTLSTGIYFIQTDKYIKQVILIID